MDETAKRVRSPLAPYIDLAKAEERIRQFEESYRSNSGKVLLAAKLWGFSEKSSSGQQTIAALLSYGWMESEGSMDDRKIKISKAGMTVLKDARPGVAEAAKKAAAMAPPVMAELWKLWGGERPPNDECLSALHLDMGFNEETAARVLRIYDANIQYAGLVEDDKLPEEPTEETLQIDPLPALKPMGVPSTPSLVGQPATAAKVPLMPNEKVIFAHDIDPQQGFRILSTGAFNPEMATALKSFADFLATLHKVPTDKAPKSPPTEGGDKTQN